jgi:NodT family efflux transporter outer membrane factor (OMF) lipoprotein
MLAGCAVGPDFHAPAPIKDISYTPGAQPAATVPVAGPHGATQRFVMAEIIGGAWWRAFGSADLDHLVQQALDASPTLVQARMRLAQAHQDYLAQAGTLWPQVDATLNTARQQINPEAFGVNFPGTASSPPFTLYHASVNVSYALDVFGANRGSLEGLAAQVDYEQYQLEAARLTLAGNVVTTAIRRASLAAQIVLSQRILAAQERQLDIADKRYRAGGIARTDVFSQRLLVEQTRASLSPLRAQLAQAEHQLAVFLGRTPAQGAGPAPDLNAMTLPTELPQTLPSALARQRPDIRASEALLHQASANLGIATANLFPQITLTGSVGQEGIALSRLASVWSIAGGLTQPLFHGGQLRAREKSAEDAYEAAAGAYRQTVLQGLQQVADVLRALEQDAAELASRESAQRDAQAAAGIARRRYELGGISQLALLDAQRQELQTALDRTRTQAQRLSDTAALFQALGARP